MKKFLEEFKAFAIKGNVIDMAVGVIIGGAFSKIVSSLVGDVVTPLLSLLIGKDQFASLVWTVGETQILIGNFLQNIIDFFFTALVIFCFIKVINKLKHEKPAEPEPVKEPEISSTDKLLMEILEEVKKHS